MNQWFFRSWTVALALLCFAHGPGLAQEAASGAPAAPVAPVAPVAKKVAPVLGSVMPPKYPVESKAAREEGVVKLRVVVDKTGWTQEARVLESSGFPRLDAAALDAARHWRYRPGTVDGVSTAMALNVPVRFQLEKPKN